MSDYPEHEKLAAVQDQSQAVGEFLDTCGYQLCEVHSERWYPVHKPISTLLADFYGIDEAVLEQEKRAMLGQARVAAPSGACGSCGQLVTHADPYSRGHECRGSRCLPEPD